jgi:cell division protein FtsN
MTELVNKKSKEGRYRIESNIAEIDPVIEPLTDLDDDEDAIDRLLINTGFDAEEDFPALPPAQGQTLSVHQDPILQLNAFSDDEVLAALQTDDDEYIEPADIGSPIADIESAPAPSPYEATFANTESFLEHEDPVSVDDHKFSAFHNRAAEFTASLHDAFASPDNASDPSEPVDIESPVPGADDLAETSYIGSVSSEDHDELFEQEPEPNNFSQSHVGGEAPVTAYSKLSDKNSDDDTPEVDIPSPEKDIALDAPAPPYDWNRLLSMQEDARQQMVRLETRAKNARRLSYAAIALSLAALGAALAVGYLNVQTRAELTKLKDMQSIMEEDMSGLNEKLDSDNQAAEDSTEKPSHLSDEREAEPEDKPTAADTPSPPETESIQAKTTPAPTVANKKPSSQSVRKTQALSTKPAMDRALPKPSKAYLAKPAAGETGGHWSVNLASYRQINDARKKAAEFLQKGVSVKVTKVDIKRATWYRLSVPGFKTKEAASIYSSRLKKLLRLNSIWVAAI